MWRNMISHISRPVIFWLKLWMPELFQKRRETLSGRIWFENAACFRQRLSRSIWRTTTIQKELKNNCFRRNWQTYLLWLYLKAVKLWISGVLWRFWGWYNSVAQTKHSRGGMLLVPPKERFHFSAFWTERYGVSEKDKMNYTNRYMYRRSLWAL